LEKICQRLKDVAGLMFSIAVRVQTFFW